MSFLWNHNIVFVEYPTIIFIKLTRLSIVDLLFVFIDENSILSTVMFNCTFIDFIDRNEEDSLTVIVWNGC